MQNTEDEPITLDESQTEQSSTITPNDSKKKHVRQLSNSTFNLKDLRVLPIEIPAQHMDHHVKDSSSASNASEKKQNVNSTRSVQLGVGEDHFILLPHHHERVNHFALDIGGSLVKMVYYEAEGAENRTRSRTIPPKSPIPVHDRFAICERQLDLLTQGGTSPTATTMATSLPSLDSPKRMGNRGARICFARFKTADIEECLSLINDLTTQYGKCECVHATGGGAFKFTDLLEERFGIKIKKLDEMESLISGLNFLLKNVHDETFVYKSRKKTDYTKRTSQHFRDYRKHYISFKGKSDEEIYPYLLVNIGSGVSVLRVNGDREFDRVSGSSVGGGSFWGLGSLLTNCNSFEELLDMTLRGDNKNCDLLVDDIYGRDYAKIGLSGDTIASSFGKIAVKKTRDLEERNGSKPSSEDIAKSLLYMICNNIGQIAYLNALRYGMKRIYFAGYFIRDHPITMSSISYAIDFWSKGEIQAFFLKHEGYLGAIGSFFNSNENTFIVDDEEDDSKPQQASSSDSSSSSSDEEIQCE